MSDFWAKHWDEARGVMRFSVRDYVTAIGGAATLALGGTALLVGILGGIGAVGLVLARLAGLAVVVVMLVGCTTAVTLKHPDGRIAKCGPYDARPLNSFSSAERERGCIQDFQRQGFERVSE